VKSLGASPARCIHTHPIKRARISATPWSSASAPSSPTIRMKCVNSPGSGSARDCCCASRSVVPRRVRSVAQVRLRSGELPGAGASGRGLGVDVQGISFHVGSQAADPAKHVEAIEACAKLLAAARREKLGTLDTLDIVAVFPSTMARRYRTSGASALHPSATGEAAQAHPGHRRAGALHRRSAAIGVASVMGRAQREATGGTTSMTACTAPTAGSCTTMPATPWNRCALDRITCPRARRSDLRQHRCDRREPDAAEARVGDLIIGRQWRLHLASASEFNFFPRATVCP